MVGDDVEHLYEVLNMDVTPYVASFAYIFCSSTLKENPRGANVLTVEHTGKL